MTRVRAASRAFREPDIISVHLDPSADFNEFESRRNRYDIGWSFYESTQYIESIINKWNKLYKTDFGLGKYIRSIYNPAYRLGSFWQAHLWGGALGQLPIIPEDEDNENLLGAISQIFQWSNWETQKDIVPLYGSVLGDVGLKVVEDTERGKVYLEIIHPGNIAHVDLDVFGNVKGYVLEEERLNPDIEHGLTHGLKDTVVFSEIVTKDGDNITFETLRDGQPFPWNGVVAEWSRPYGFVPFVMIQHNNVGLPWGFSEIHPGQSKFREVDDLISMLDDQIRKTVNPVWFISGAQAGSGTTTLSESNLTGTAAANKPQPGREEVPMIFAGSKDARIQAMIAEIDIPGTSQHILELLRELEKDYPEISAAVVTPSGETSGRALRIARQPVETKVNQRRPNYDNALIRALQMAVAIGGEADFIPDFNLASFEAGDLNFEIGDRPIFAIDPLDDLDVLKAQGEAIQLLTNSGAGILEAAIFIGLSEEEAAALAQVDTFGGEEGR